MSDKSFSADLTKLFFDKILLAAIVGLAGYLWAHVVEADATFWANETSRFQVESELVFKIEADAAKAPIQQASLTGLANNGFAEAKRRICTYFEEGNPSWWRIDLPRMPRTKDFSRWCSASSTGGTVPQPDDADYVALRVMSPGRRALYEAIYARIVQIVHEPSPVGAAQSDPSSTPPPGPRLDGSSKPPPTSAPNRSSAISEQSLRAQTALADTVDRGFRANSGLEKVADQLALKDTTPTQLRDIVAKAPPVALPEGLQTLARSLPLRVYFQVDAKSSEAAEGSYVKAIRRLTDAGYLIAGKPDHVQHNRMPSKCQIRYFNAEDAKQAEAVAKLLRAETGEQFETVQIPIKAPPNQVEVWWKRSP